METSGIKAFTPDVQEQLQYYVYRLIDPRDGQTFYVGKGRGNRIFAHVAGALNGYWEEDEDDTSAKIQQIREIHQAGLSVIHVIQRFGLTENEAFEVEAALIDCFPGLTNLQKGIIQSEALTMQRYSNASFPAKYLRTEMISVT